MKTVFKKMLSLVLVAMLLVTAIPFQAMAAEDNDETTQEPIVVPVIVTLDGEVINSSKSITVNPGESYTLNEETAMAQITKPEGRAFESWSSTNKGPFTEGSVSYGWLTKDAPEGYTLTINLVSTSSTPSEPTPSEPTPSEPTPSEPEDDNTTANLYVNGEKIGEAVFNKNGKLISCTEAPSIKGKSFQGWFSKENGEGYEMYKNMGGKVIYDNYYAYYIDSSDDGLCTLSVVAVYYVNGNEKARKTVYSEDYAEGTEDALNILMQSEDEIWNNIVKKVPYNFVDEKFTWNHKFYDKSFTTDLTTQDLVLKGDRTVYVKVKSSVEAPVSLEIHRKVSSKSERTVWMTGYLAGDLVTLSDAVKVVKDYYTVSSKNVKMYTDDQWQDLVDNDNTAKFVEQIEVESNTKTTKIHVLLTNATSGSSTADSSNPKTGDSIFMAVTVMALSASALAAAYIFNKKRAI